MTNHDEQDVLYVEDNLDHAELVLRCLEDHGIRQRVFHVEDGEQALTRLQQVKDRQAARPKLVLLDLRLPRVDGLEVLRQIKLSPELRDIPVIVFTTSAGTRDMREAYANHANSYLVKPDDLTTLTTLLNDLSTYWLEHNQLLAGPPPA
jgi:CheY-like chemotaxis protein